MHQIQLFSRQCILMIEGWATLRLAHWVLLTYKARTAFGAAWHGWRDLPLFESFRTQISILRISSKHCPWKKLMKNFPFLQRLIYRRDPWWETDFATLRWSPKLVSVTVSWGRFSKWCLFDRPLSQPNRARGESGQSEYELVSINLKTLLRSWRTTFCFSLLFYCWIYIWGYHIHVLCFKYSTTFDTVISGSSSRRS